MQCLKCFKAIREGDIYLIFFSCKHIYCEVCQHAISETVTFTNCPVCINNGSNMETTTLIIKKK